MDVGDPLNPEDPGGKMMNEKQWTDRRSRKAQRQIAMNREDCMG